MLGLGQSMGPAWPGAFPGPLPVWVMALAYLAAAALFAFGLWFLWASRRTSEATPQTALGRWQASLSRPSQAAVGLGSVLLAYHAVVYTGPSTWQLLMVPRQWWWLLVLGVAVLVTASLLMDHTDRHDQR